MNENFYIAFEKKNYLSCFETFLKAKICQQIKISINFSAVNNWYILKNQKKSLYILSLKKIFGVNFEILTSSLHYLIFNFYQKLEMLSILYTYMILSIKFGFSIFISFGDIKNWIFPTQSQIYMHMYTPTFNIYFFFFTQGTPKYKSPKNSMSKNVDRMQYYHNLMTVK